MQVIYVDEVFIINFAADYLLLLATAKISGVTVRRSRMAVAAVVGGLYSVGAQFVGLVFFTTVFFKAAAAVLMALIVFGGKQNFFRLLLIFMAVSAAFAGAVMGASLLGGAPCGHPAEPVTFDVFIFSFAVCWFVFSVIFNHMVKHRADGNICSMEVRVSGRKIRFSALTDTGNSLTDPMTGENVTICSAGDAVELFDKEQKKILKTLSGSEETEVFQMLKRSGEEVPFFLIPYKTVGKSSGLLIAFRPDEIYKNGKKTPGGLIGVVPKGIVEGKGYSAVTGVK